MRSRLIILSCLNILLITACGGGGGSESSAVVTPPVISPTPTPPTPDPTPTPNPPVENQPNILLIIADDQGLDASNQYNISNDTPITPTLNRLASVGIVFENAWATPACTTTRAAIITGKYGINSGVDFVPAQLSTEHQVLQQYLKNNTATEDYQSAVFGKWHLGGGRSDANHPQSVGVDYYAGNLANISDYYAWDLTVNGSTQTTTEYHTTKITDLALEWINQQSTPWFAWVAYSAPHAPFHLPPADLHTQSLSGQAADITANRREYYLAAIEAMDTEIGRMLSSMDASTLANTVIIYLGDNGTPRNVIDSQAYIAAHSKGSLYQGGVAVPMFVSGKGVERVANTRESALVGATDLYTTIAQIAGSTESSVNDSQSFYALLSDDQTSSRNLIYTEFKSNTTTGWTVRSADYKLIEFSDGSQELFALSDNFSETNDLSLSTNADITASKDSLKSFGNNITQPSSAIDITNVLLNSTDSNCVSYVNNHTSNVMDVNEGTLFMGDLKISVEGEKCVFSTNAIPNHDFNDGERGFPNSVSAQDDRFEIPTSPSTAQQTTPLSLTTDNALLLNGVKVDLLAAGCFGVGDGRIGCNDINQPWRYDPMHPESGFSVDSHNAHAQPDGTYHYHGSPFALFADDSSAPSPVIGFAADGFPIFGSFFDDNGTIRKALPSYQLKQGQRPDGDDNPDGPYDGAFRDDYEYVENAGDLDECNGMTHNDVYGYYVTDGYPYVLGCFKGTPDTSFNKR